MGDTLTVEHIIWNARADTSKQASCKWCKSTAAKVYYRLMEQILLQHKSGAISQFHKYGEIFCILYLLQVCVEYRYVAHEAGPLTQQDNAINYSMV